MKFLKKRWPWLLAVPALIAAAAWWQLAQRPAAPQWVTAPVERQDLQDVVIATGSIKAQQQVNVGAQATGQIKALHVKVGDVVQPGQLIAEIDATTQQNALRDELAGIKSLQAQITARQAALTLARQNLTRQEQMMASDATARADLQTAQNQFAAARADLKMSQAALEQAMLKAETARANLGYTRILAPMAGTIVAVVTEQGQTVNAAMSSPTIVKLAKLDTVRIEAQISEADVPRVKPGMPAWFTLLGDADTRHETSLESIALLPPAQESSAESASSATTTATAIYYNGIFNAPNPDGLLRVAMTAQVHIVVAEAKQALTIPYAALGAKQPDGRHEVRVLPAGDASAEPETRLVRTGLNNRIHVQVLDGLQEGDHVITGQASAQPVISSSGEGEMFVPPPPM